MYACFAHNYKEMEIWEEMGESVTSLIQKKGLRESHVADAVKSHRYTNGKFVQMEIVLRLSVWSVTFS